MILDTPNADLLNDPRRLASGASIQEWKLWHYLTEEMGMNPGFYRSDVFELLAAILAYYQARGTSPEQMLGEHLKKRIAALLEATAETPP